MRTLAVVLLLIHPAEALACGACADAVARVHLPTFSVIPVIMLLYAVASLIAWRVLRRQPYRMRASSTFMQAGVVAFVPGVLMTGGGISGGVAATLLFVVLGAVVRVFQLARLEDRSLRELVAAGLTGLFLLVTGGTYAYGRAIADRPETLLDALAATRPGAQAAFDRLHHVDVSPQVLAAAIRSEGITPARPDRLVRLLLLSGEIGGEELAPVIDDILSETDDCSVAAAGLYALYALSPERASARAPSASSRIERFDPDCREEVEAHAQAILVRSDPAIGRCSALSPLRRSDLLTRAPGLERFQQDARKICEMRGGVSP